ncbi:MAG: SMP-30/gluconolactonase/LRE family protein [Cyclobacteriaceae bacterium]|nr:SMP-30/gluconolactonase/LRE family protein [Cyclobacteriaceae bacterium]
MRIVGVILILFFINWSSLAQYYEARDLTAENVFTENIEGPNVDKAGNLYVVNFQRDGTIGFVKPNGEVELFVTLPEGSVANAIMFDKKGNMLLADWKGHNVLKVDAKTKAVSVYVRSEHFNQPNDLCISKKGKLFASDPNWKESTGKLWRIDGPGKATLLADNMGTTNGIELSPDETKLYVNESVQRTVWVFDVDRKGNISNKKLFYQFEDFGLDGMKCDKLGNLYITRHGKGIIAILSPEGKLLHEVKMAGKLTSNLTFGGLDGKTCFVTLQDRKCVEVFESEVAGKNFK